MIILLMFFLFVGCQHGGGQVFKSLQRLVQNLDAEKISVGTIIAEDESMTSRHLRILEFPSSMALSQEI